MNSYIDSLRKLAAGQITGQPQAPKAYYPQDQRTPTMPYEGLGPGLRQQTADGTGHTFRDAVTGKEYSYNQWNTPIDTGNFALTRLLMDRTKGSPYHRTTVADAINMQVQDPQYVTKYRQHLNRQAQRSGNKPLYHGFWPYTQAKFDTVMSTPLSSLIRFDRQLRGRAYYDPKQGRIHLPSTGSVLASLTGYKPAYSTRPRTSQQTVLSSLHIPTDLGAAAMHQVNHYTHEPKGSDLGAYAGTSSFQLPKIDPYSRLQPQQLQMNAAYTRGKYALIQKLRSNPNDPAFSQFDKQKLKQIAAFPQFIGTDIPGLIQFRRQMRFWRQNPQLAQMLGTQAARMVGSYTQLLNAWDQYEKAGETIPDVLKQAILRFQDNRYLGDARRHQYQKQLRNAQRTQYA